MQYVVTFNLWPPDCDMLCHRACLEQLKESCAGVKKDKRKSIIDKIITRKPSSNNASASKQ